MRPNASSFLVNVLRTALAVFAFINLTACADGIGPADSSDVAEVQQDLDSDGTPDAFDNCPGTPNTADVVVPGLAACTVPSDCVGAPGMFSNGTPIPVASNPWTATSAVVGVFCVESQCRLQADADLDGGGDACDSDDDNDGIADGVDNCPTLANPDQRDNDGNGGGDACDSDDDNDGIADGVDNCPFTSNSDQTDTDEDGLGDACEEDIDGDGVPNADDNCLTTPNLAQTDTDEDGLGDACDSDLDGDGVPNADDNCPGVPNADQANNDSDAQGDACDDDNDNDTVVDVDDNCPTTPNLAQTDTDEDGLGDACDSDLDGDGVPNADDNCPGVPNADQANNDSDAQGDACDLDCDGDGIPEVSGPEEFPNVCSADIDGDGFLTPADCLEGNGSIHPGATEVCDMIDQDCDGVRDNGATCPVAGQSCISGVCQAPECTVPSDCNDGLFCNGVETCAGGACGAGTNPCAAGTTCNETTNSCDVPPPATCPAGQYNLLGVCVDEPPPGSCYPFAVNATGTLSGGTQYYAEFYGSFGPLPTRSGAVNNGVVRSTADECSVVVGALASGASCTCTTHLGSSACAALPAGGFGCRHNQPAGL